jgi:prepilin-type N-terminal cleavage/methylation domain-containing protein
MNRSTQPFAARSGRRPASRLHFGRGFTLIELLVVISIIALLVSILLPALGSARAAAVQIKCQSQIRSIGQSLFAYQADHSQYYPYGVNAEGFPGTWPHYKSYFNDSLNSYLGFGTYDVRDTVREPMWHCAMLWSEIAGITVPGDSNSRAVWNTDAWGLYSHNTNVMGAIDVDGAYPSTSYAPYGDGNKQNIQEADLHVSPSSNVLFADGYRPMTWWTPTTIRTNETVTSHLVMPHFSASGMDLQYAIPRAGDQVVGGGTGSALFQDGHARAAKALDWPNSGTGIDSWQLDP